MTREEHAIILEYLPNGYPLEGKMMPVAQAVGEETLVLLELAPRRDVGLQIGEVVYIGQGKRDKIYYILGRLKKDKLTEAAKQHLEEVILNMIEKNEEKYMKFFNTSEALNKKVHQLELLPGLGKRHMQEILKHRSEREFESFEDIKKRITNIPDPKKAIERRIFKELTNDERYHLFVE